MSRSESEAAARNAFTAKRIDKLEKGLLVEDGWSCMATGCRWTAPAGTSLCKAYSSYREAHSGERPDGKVHRISRDFSVPGGAEEKRKAKIAWQRRGLGPRAREELSGSGGW